MYIACQVLPEAAHRGGRGFGDDYFAGQVQPLRKLLRTLFDVDHLIAWGSSAAPSCMRCDAGAGQRQMQVQPRCRISLVQARPSRSGDTCQIIPLGACKTQQPISHPRHIYKRVQHPILQPCIRCPAILLIHEDPALRHCIAFGCNVDVARSYRGAGHAFGG